MLKAFYLSAKGAEPMAATIGIKIANGEFYSIIEENSSVKKRLVLTTVHDKQRSVQIDLYKSFAKTMADALYIGSLVVENIKPKQKGEPSIELVISSKKDGEISADAIDLDTSSGGEHHYLNVSLKSLDEDNREYEIPDFELEQHEGPPTGLYERAEAAKEPEAKGFPVVPVIIIGLILVLICLGLWYFLFRGGSGEKGQPRPASESTSPNQINPQSPATRPPASQNAEGGSQTTPSASAAPSSSSSSSSSSAATAPGTSAAQTPPVITAPPAAPRPAAAANRNRPPAPVSSYKVPATIPRDGAPYTIRWGDTLWDISEAFYRNPWLYPRIARFNNIRNPDLIISGTTIRIPPQN
jgi:LysM repeat protein